MKNEKKMKYVLAFSFSLVKLKQLNFFLLFCSLGVEPGQHDTPLSPKRLFHCNTARWRFLLLLLPLV